MAYYTKQLITRAYYLSGLVSRGLQTPTAEQIEDGLELLNDLLGFSGSDLTLIPYFSRYEFESVPGQEEYFISNLVNVETLTYNLGPARFSMKELIHQQRYLQETH